MATRGRIRYGTKIGNRFNISNDMEELKEVDSKTKVRLRGKSRPDPCAEFEYSKS